MKYKPVFVGLTAIIFYFCFLSACIVLFIASMRRGPSTETLLANILTSCGGASILYADCMQIAKAYPPETNSLYRKVNPDDVNVPQNIRKLHLQAIHVSPEDVHLIFYQPGHRLSVIAFRAGSPQYGTAMITNGLWYWGGSASLETREIYLKQCERDEQFFEARRRQMKDESDPRR